MNATGKAHRLGPMEGAADEARKCLQSRRDSVKRRKEEVGYKMKKYRELLGHLVTEYNNTMEKMKRQKEEQASESCLTLYWMHSAGGIMSYPVVLI